jgi:hypothetical protein
LLLVGKADDLDGLMPFVPEEHQQEIRSAAAKAIASTKMHGGDWRVSYSKNGRYRLDKTALSGSIKDEIAFVSGRLFDEDGVEIAQWPRMYKNVFISNNGRNLVAAEMTWGTGFDFYDRDHMEPIRSIKRYIGDGQFSADGRFFVALSAGVSLFTAEGELLWNRSTKGGGMVFISLDGGCVVLSNGRPAKGDEPPPVTTEHEEPGDPGPKVIRYDNLGQVNPQEGLEPRSKMFGLPERKPVHLSPGSATPVTAFSADGEVLLEYDTHLYRIDEVTFADDGRQFAVVGTNEILLFGSDSGALLKRIAVGPPWDDIAKVAFSPDGRFLVAAITRYPTSQDPSRTTTHRYELWDLQGDERMEIEADELGTPAFSEDGRYVVCQRGWKPIYQNEQQVGYAPGSLSLLRVVTDE